MEPTDFPNRLLGELRLSEGANNNVNGDNRSNNVDNGTLWSPDEFVIRARGRRRISVWSPEANPSTTQVSSPFQRTPTKMPLSTSMILRSSPRKRLTMGSTPSNDPVDDRYTCSPMKTNIRMQLWTDTPGNAKKPRLNETEHTSIACQNNDVPLATLLRGYSQDQLIQLILEQVANGKSDEKAKEEQLRAKLPTPTVDSMERELQHAKRNIFKSLPTSRLCKKTDSAAYSRASLHLNEMKRLLGLHTKELQDSCHWDALLDYVIMSWPYVRSTPIWDNASHNAIRRQCFKLLSSNCIAAIKAAGLRLGSGRLNALERNLHDWAKDYEDVLVCITTLNKTLTKGRTSL